MDDIVWIYLVVINVIGFLSMGVDKAKAKKGVWRVPEKTLFLFPILGGGLGSWIGMYTFHHKTKHWYFVIGIPAIFFIELGIAAYILIKFNLL